VPYAPIFHPFVERLIGTVRREFRDQVSFWGTIDLKRKRDSLKGTYNQNRMHEGIGGQTPCQEKVEAPTAAADLHHYGWKSHYHGLFQLPVAA